jgi:hypothetical protein
LITDHASAEMRERRRARPEHPWADLRGVKPGCIDDDPFDVIAGLDPAIHSKGISVGYADGMDARLGGRA